MIMRPIEQTNINTAPENKTIKLSVVAARHLVKTNVDNLLEEKNKVSLTVFAENENNTMLLWEMLWVPKDKLWLLTLGETLEMVGVDKYQTANNTDYDWKTVQLWAFSQVA